VGLFLQPRSPHGAQHSIHTQKKPRLRERTDRAWFSLPVRHPARKRSGSIPTTPELARGMSEQSPTHSRSIWRRVISANHMHWYWQPNHGNQKRKQKKTRTTLNRAHTSTTPTDDAKLLIFNNRWDNDPT